MSKKLHMPENKSLSRQNVLYYCTAAPSDTAVLESYSITKPAAHLDIYMYSLWEL